MVDLSLCALYIYRDIWPLMVFNRHPADEAEGSLLYTKIALIVFVGVVEPLFEPYPYISYDPLHPMAVPNPEQTASIFSFMFYIFLDIARVAVPACLQ